MPAIRGSEDASREPAHLFFAADHEIHDTRILDLPEIAMAMIAARIAEGAPIRRTVIEIIRNVFTSSMGIEDLHRLPDTDPILEDQLDRLLADPVVVDRVVLVVLDVVEGDQP